MMTEKEKKELILDFFSKGLSEEQKIQFRELMANDKDFVKEFLRAVELNEAYKDVFGEGDKYNRDM